MIDRYRFKTPNIKIAIDFDGDKVQREADRWAKGFLRKFGAFVRRAARSSIKRKGHARKAPKGEKAKARRLREIMERKPSPPGTPPYTWTGLLKESIVFQVNTAARNVIIGPTARIIDDVGMGHEYGGRYRGNRYPARPFMGPAFEKGKADLIRKQQRPMPRMWARSVR